MKYLLQKRFNMVDMIGGSVVSIYISRGEVAIGLLLGVIGAFISIVYTGIYSLRYMNQQWQTISDQGNRVGAIKKHRELFKTGLKEAVEAVQRYESNRRM